MALANAPPPRGGGGAGRPGAGNPSPPAHDAPRVTEPSGGGGLPAWARLMDWPANRHRELKEAMRHTLGKLKTAAEAATDPAGPP